MQKAVIGRNFVKKFLPASFYNKIDTFALKASLRLTRFKTNLTQKVRKISCIVSPVLR